ATARVHGGERVSGVVRGASVLEDEAGGALGGFGKRAFGKRWFAQKLAVRGVAEVRVNVRGCGSDEKRARSDGLGREGVRRGVRRAFGGDDGGDREFALNADDAAEMAGGVVDGEGASVGATEFVGDFDGEG